MSSFWEAKQEFDASFGKAKTLPTAWVTVNGKTKTDIVIKRANGMPNEEYYKWQFIYSLTRGQLVPPEHIGAEVHFPKGNASAAPLKLDAAIFDDDAWLEHYLTYWKTKNSQELEWLKNHLVAAIEFKEQGGKPLEKAILTQLKPAMNEKDPSDAGVFGFFYDTGRLMVFFRKDGFMLRYDESKNQKGPESKIGDLSLHLPDPYSAIPTLKVMLQVLEKETGSINRTSRRIEDLEIIPSILTIQTKDAFSHLLRSLDKHSLSNQRGYQLLIQSFALKIVDEKRTQSDKSGKKNLRFYVTAEEQGFSKLSEPSIRKFITRMQEIEDEARGAYSRIFRESAIDWQDVHHVRMVVAVAQAFQDYSFVRSATGDLYQTVFYNFATEFKRDQQAQFLTPIPVIEFLVSMVNPRPSESVFDPCCGIGDFLALAFGHARANDKDLDESGTWGVDKDPQMIMLATLNMLLNGDGKVRLEHVEDLGSLAFKPSLNGSIIELDPVTNLNGNWEKRVDKNRLLKFDVVLTNPPFGEDRAFRPTTDAEKGIATCYETWNLTGSDSLDLGVMFLENACRSLKPNGRLGIVLSNSIASINRWEHVRQWLMDNMRIVALVDLPPNVFAETGVNTTIIVAYKPKASDLKTLNDAGYQVFVKDVQAVGYEKRTSKRNVFFNPVYKINPTTFEVQTDERGSPVLDEEFSETLDAFQKWARTQEANLRRAFLGDDM